jgi:hypothetical protein
VNYYGEKSGPEHQLFGRLAPVCEALQRAMFRATGKAVEPLALSNSIPEWCHKIADRLAVTIFKRVVGLNPKGKFDARNYGRMVGMFLRAITHFCKEVPAQLKRNGLINLEPEKEKKVEAMIDIPAMLSFASKMFNRPISNEAELGEAGAAELENKVEQQIGILLAAGLYLANRPVAEQHAFLCGIPEGFTLFLDNDGDLAGQKPRTELYLLLLMHWPEIAEMQMAEPPKTCKFLLNWLEKQEGTDFVDDDGRLKREPKKLVEDQKVFNGLCCEIGLVMGPPGHPHKGPPV